MRIDKNRRIKPHVSNLNIVTLIEFSTNPCVRKIFLFAYTFSYAK